MRFTRAPMSGYNGKRCKLYGSLWDFVFLSMTFFAFSFAMGFVAAMWYLNLISVTINILPS